MVIVTDVADEAQVEAAASRDEAQWGPIDVWVNNAMATIFSEALRIDAADFRGATEVTYLGAVWGTLAALRRMKPRDRGVIVEVGSAGLGSSAAARLPGRCKPADARNRRATMHCDKCIFRVGLRAV